MEPTRSRRLVKCSVVVKRLPDAVVTRTVAGHNGVGAFRRMGCLRCKRRSPSCAALRSIVSAISVSGLGSTFLLRAWPGGCEELAAGLTVQVGLEIAATKKPRLSGLHVQGLPARIGVDAHTG